MGLFRRRNKNLATVPEPASVTSPSSASSSGTRPLAKGPFRMVVKDVFVIPGRGASVTGTVEAGTVRVGGQVTVERAGQAAGSLVITGIELYGKTTDVATAGDSTGLLFRDVARKQIVRGDVLRS